MRRAGLTRWRSQNVSPKTTTRKRSESGRKNSTKRSEERKRDKSAVKTKETTIKILFLAIVCALISATIFSMKPPRAVSYAETGNCPHEYDDDCDDECNLCGEKRTPKHYFGEWIVVKEATNDEEGLKERTCVRCNVKQQAILQKTAVPEPQKEKSFQNRISRGLS